MYTVYFECSKPNGIISGTVMFSTSEAASKFSDEFKSLDGVASTNRKTIIIGEPEEAV